MSTKIVADGLIQQATLYKPRYWLFRLDVLPFVISYTVLFTLTTISAEADQSLLYVGLITLPIVFSLHLLLFLLAQWSVKIRCTLGYQIVTDIHQADMIHVTAAQNAGKDKLCKLSTNKHFATAKGVEVIEKKFMITRERLDFQKVHYNFDADRNTFMRLDYPTTGSLHNFLEWQGHTTSEDVGLSLMRWGMNEYDIPIPNFLDLYLDHLVAPFFVFQVLCLFLWSLDDYWYYSVFTLLMLMFFEGMMCKQRQSSLMMLRNMRRPPVRILCYRTKQWLLVSSDTLVPGDIISLTADSLDRKLAKSEQAAGGSGGDEQRIVPCDALLVRGSCVVNEAMLTGESVPQMKETLRTRSTATGTASKTNSSAKVGNTAAAAAATASTSSGSTVVDLGSDTHVEAEWKRHMVFSGTALLQHTPVVDADATTASTTTTTSTTTTSAGGAAAAVVIPSAPDGGCLAVVVRTGFGTSQGGLMRKILFATERVTGEGSSNETFYFIGVLVVFAVIAATVVLRGGLGDEKRNKFRLVLHCIMIVTSVVPPELPMELSLAVTNSLAALARSLVYCTEPFRISFAGRLDTICFDKTGTLTKDQMILKGVVAPQDVSIIPLSAAAEEEEEKKKKEMDDLMLSERSHANEDILLASTSSDIVLAMMGSCHDLMIPTVLTTRDAGDASNNAISDLIGDPLEIAAMEASGFAFRLGKQQSHSEGGGNVLSVEHEERNLRVTIRHKYPFTSALKRMSIVAECSNVHPSTINSSSSSGGAGKPQQQQSKTMVFTKGAPEVLAQYLKEVPAFYNATYFHHMSRGRRVLALAYKPLSSVRTAADFAALRRQSRAEVEQDLMFAGFLIFDCDLKVDSRSVVRELKAAAHQVVMITGDSVYTAADVARRLSMLKSSKPNDKNAPPRALIMHAVTTTAAATNLKSNKAKQDTTSEAEGKVELIWRALGSTFSDDKVKEIDDISFSITDVASLAVEHSLCVTGPALEVLQRHYPAASLATSAFRRLCAHVTIFARVSPAQKEAIILALNSAGLYTLMCGDGTNDVGALKAAHVGVSIVNDPLFEKKIEGVKDNSSSSSASGKKGSSSAAAAKKAKGSSAKDRMARAVAELHEQEMDPTIVKLGDASIASPFTARRTSIDSVLSVIRQGRCTLVTTIQVYKVLALNCLVSAYMMSALYLRGLKQGDTQMTASGLVIAGLFFFLSQAKPVVGIAAQKPTSSIFAPAVCLSLLGQFIVHFGSLLAVLYICEQYVDKNDFSLSPDGKFQPNVVNSAVFLLSALMQVNNFVINYRGHPFTQSIFENLYLWRSVQVLYALLLIVAGGQVEPLNDLLQMAPFPSPEFQGYLIGILLVNFGACYVVEHASKRLE